MGGSAEETVVVDIRPNFYSDPYQTSLKPFLYLQKTIFEPLYLIFFGKQKVFSSGWVGGSGSVFIFFVLNIFQQKHSFLRGVWVGLLKVKLFHFFCAHCPLSFERN